MEQPPCTHHARCGCLSAHRASPVFPITWPVKLVSYWSFLVPQWALSLETQPSSCVVHQTLHSHREDRGWRMGEGKGGGKDKGSLIRVRNERVGSSPVFLPADRHLLLQKRPITTYMAQPSTSCLLLKLGTSRWVSSKRGHHVAQFWQAACCPGLCTKATIAVITHAYLVHWLSVSRSNQVQSRLTECLPGLRGHAACPHL